MAWVTETDTPFAEGGLQYFSPILTVGSSTDRVVFVNDKTGETFELYNLTTKAWTSRSKTGLGTGTTFISFALALSPDWSTLCSTRQESNVIHFYNISGDSWSASTACAVESGGHTVTLRGVVWAANDTVYCSGKWEHPASTWNLAIFKYVKGVNWTNGTWTELGTGMVSTSNIPQGVSINTAGTIIYVGDGAMDVVRKVVIATTTYSTLTPGAATDIPPYCSDGRAKIWYYNSSYVTFYYDCDLEANVTQIAEANSARDKTTFIAYGVHPFTHILIAFHKTTNPANYSIEIAEGSPATLTVTTQGMADVVGTTATGRGTLVTWGVDGAVTQYGHVWDRRSEAGETTTTDSTSGFWGKTTKGASSTLGAFTSALTGLTPGVEYRVRGYAIEGAGTVYGAYVYFVAGEVGSGYQEDGGIRVVTTKLRYYGSDGKEYEITGVAV